MISKIKSYVHVHRLEDVWADCKSDEDVRRMDYSHLTLDEIENLDFARIPNTMEDTSDIVDLVYYEQKIVDTPLPPIQWSKKESKSISKRFAPIIAITNQWLLKKGIWMKPLPASSSEEDNDGLVGKTSEVRTKNKEDTQVPPPPVSPPKSKGKAPKFIFTIKGLKKGESSSMAMQQESAQGLDQAEEEEQEQEEGEIPHTREEHEQGESYTPTTSQTSSSIHVVIHSIDSDSDEEGKNMMKKEQILSWMMNKIKKGPMNNLLLFLAFLALMAFQLP